MPKVHTWAHSKSPLESRIRGHKHPSLQQQNTFLLASLHQLFLATGSEQADSRLQGRILKHRVQQSRKDESPGGKRDGGTEAWFIGILSFSYRNFYVFLSISTRLLRKGRCLQGVVTCAITGCGYVSVLLSFPTFHFRYVRQLPAVGGLIGVGSLYLVRTPSSKLGKCFAISCSYTLVSAASLEQNRMATN